MGLDACKEIVCCFIGYIQIYAREYVDSIHTLQKYLTPGCIWWHMNSHIYKLACTEFGSLNEPLEETPMYDSSEI